MNEGDLPKQWSTVTSRAFDIIEAIDELEGATVTELADHLAIAASTVHNHLGALQRRDYVVKEDDVYSLGLRFLTLGISVRDERELAQIAKPVIEDMAMKTGEVAWTVVMENDWLFFVDAAVGENGINTYGKIGSRRQPHANASGKAILAHLSRDEVDGILDRTGMPSMTDKTITDRDELFEEFESIRQKGYAVNRGEYFEGGCAIASAVLKEGRPIGSLGISGPSRRFQDDRLTGELADVLLEGKNVVELELLAPS